MLSSIENPDSQLDRKDWALKWLERLLVTLGLIFLAMILYGFFAWYRGEWIVHGKAQLRDLKLALSNFKTEYDALPVIPDESQILRTEGTLVVSLLGAKTAVNPRGVKFIDFPIAYNRKSGLINHDFEVKSTLTEIALVDQWGERYYLLLESTGDGRIPNPERLPGASGNALQHAPEFISASSLIFSSGPDKDPKTWDDNYCSWR